MCRIHHPQLLVQLLPREVGHPHIHDHGVERALAQARQTVLAARGRLDLVAATREVALQGDSHRRFVVHDEDAQPIARRGCGGDFGELLGGAGRHDRDLDDEARATCRGVLRPDPAAVLAHDAERD